MTTYDTEAVAKLTDKLKKADRVALGWFLACLLEVVILLVLSACNHYDREDMKAEAVKRGYAEWTATSPGRMPVVFKWKDKP